MRPPQPVDAQHLLGGEDPGLRPLAIAEDDQSRARGCGLLAASQAEKLQAALHEFEAAGDSARQGETLTALGLALLGSWQNPRIVSAHEKAVEAWESRARPTAQSRGNVLAGRRLRIAESAR